MIISQLYTLICFILTGISIGILFDIFRIIRKSFKTLDIITYIEDFIFWILTGLILIFSIILFNNGILRGYIFIGIIFGIIIHILLISKFFVNFFVIIINYVKKIIAIPLQIIQKYITHPIFKTFIYINKNISIRLKKDKNPNKIQKKRRFFWKNVEKNI